MNLHKFKIQNHRRNPCNSKNFNLLYLCMSGYEPKVNSFYRVTRLSYISSIAGKLHVYNIKPDARSYDVATGLVSKVQSWLFSMYGPNPFPNSLIVLADNFFDLLERGFELQRGSKNISTLSLWYSITWQNPGRTRLIDYPAHPLSNAVAESWQVSSHSWRTSVVSNKVQFTHCVLYSNKLFLWPTTSNASLAASKM